MLHLLFMMHFMKRIFRSRLTNTNLNDQYFNNQKKNYNLIDRYNVTGCIDLHRSQVQREVI